MPGRAPDVVTEVKREDARGERPRMVVEGFNTGDVPLRRDRRRCRNERDRRTGGQAHGDAMNSTLLRATVVAALGGLLFGFDTAVIAGTTGALTDRVRADAGVARPHRVQRALGNDPRGDVRWLSRRPLRTTGVAAHPRRALLPVRHSGAPSRGTGARSSSPGSSAGSAIGGLVGARADVHRRDRAGAAEAAGSSAPSSSTSSSGSCSPTSPTTWWGRRDSAGKSGGGSWGWWPSRRWSSSGCSTPSLAARGGSRRPGRWRRRAQVLGLIGEPDPDRALAEIVASIDAEHGLGTSACSRRSTASRSSSR